MEKKELIKELRGCSTVSGKQRTWVSDLKDDHLYKLFCMIKRGQTAKSIAKSIQQLWKIKPNSTVHSISQGILKFKKRVNHLLTSSVEKKETDFNFGSSKMSSPLKSLQKNEKIASDLRSRIEKMIKEERELGIAYPNLSKDVQSLTAFEKVIIKQRETLIRHHDKDPLERLQKEHKEHEIQERFNLLMDELVPTKDDRDKMVKAIDRMIELGEEDALTVVTESDGTKHLVNSAGEKTETTVDQ
jgi:hypothetical protein